MTTRLMTTALALTALNASVSFAACAPGDLVADAAFQLRFDLPDLGTAALTPLGRTDPSDWGTLHSRTTKNPITVGSGVQVDGYFADTSTTNTTHGWFKDRQFVMRFPLKWNGKLVITGAPGVRKQYATDYLLSDWFVARGYAYAATDKGNTGTAFYNDGPTPGDAVAEWNAAVTQLTEAAKKAVARCYGSPASRTYMTGISNGGYLTRHALENRPDLYDGGVDWEGTHWRPDGPNLFTFLPAALKYYPRYKAGDATAKDAMVAAGFAADSEFIWEHHYAVYWDLTQRTYREEFDPSYDDPITAGVPFCPSGAPLCDADYDYFTRASRSWMGVTVRDAVAKVSLTGRIGKPMITLHGTLDALLPIRVQSDDYVQMVKDAGKSGIHRYYIIEAGNHVDQLYDEFPDRLRPIVGCYRAAFLALERWVEGKGRVKPPKNQTIAKPTPGTIDETNECPELGPEFDIPLITLP